MLNHLFLDSEYEMSSPDPRVPDDQVENLNASDDMVLNPTDVTEKCDEIEDNFKRDVLKSR